MKSKLASDYIQKIMGKDFKLEKEMKTYLLAFLFLISCSMSHLEKPSEIVVMQRIWDSKDPSLAYIQLPQIKTSDWKTFEHPIKNHPLRTEISEYSDSKGVSFLYDKLDSRKEVRKIYWGVDPKKINW